MNEEDPPSPSRRLVVSGMAAGILGAAVAPSDAQNSNAAADDGSLIDPKTEYPRPPFARQVTGGQPPDKIPSFGSDTPMQRPGQPAALAPIYALFASEEASYCTGQVFAAVGGRGGP